MRRRLIRAIATWIFLFFAVTIGTVRISAQQPTPTPSAPVPTPTPTPDLEHRIYQLEVAYTQTIQTWESISAHTRNIAAAVGVLFTIMVGFQGYATGVQLRREGMALDSRLEAERQARETERTGVEQVSSVMNVVQQTLQRRLDAENEARDEARKAEERLQRFEDQVKFLERFYRGFQENIKSSRQDIEVRAFQLAQTSRHDFRGKVNELTSYVRQFDTFNTMFETLEEEPRPFSPRVPYICGIAAHYANQPETAEHHLEEVVHFHQPESDEDDISYNRRVANAYYYLGLTESNFGNHLKAIDLFEEANERDLQDRDFLTRVVTSEAYVMIDNFGDARGYLDHVEERLREIERIEGSLSNFHLRLRSRAALIRANMAILERKADWHREVQQLLEPVYKVEPQYYYATATLAQVYYQQDEANAKKKAQELFSEAYRDIERSGLLLTVTEARSKILLLMVAGLCCKHGPEEERRSAEHLDRADSLLNNLPKIGDRVCTVFSTLSKRNVDIGTIRDHIKKIRESQVLL